MISNSKDRVILSLDKKKLLVINMLIKKWGCKTKSECFDLILSDYFDILIEDDDREYYEILQEVNLLNDTEICEKYKDIQRGL